MVTALEILQGYITCEDPATRNKFFNLLNSFWHKGDGKVLKASRVAENGDRVLTFLDQDGKTQNITFPALPNSKKIDFIENLRQELDNRVKKSPGKGLSSNDFTTELLNKLKDLQNYEHPEQHSIADIQNLQEILEELQPKAPEGFGFSQENFSETNRKKLEKLNEMHYAAPVADLEELAAIPYAEIANRQRRYVQAEGVDYFFDSSITAENAKDGDIAPTDQVESAGFWVGNDFPVEIEFWGIDEWSKGESVSPIPEPEPVYEAETSAYLNAIEIEKDNIYYRDTPQEINGAAIWLAIDSFIKDLKQKGIYNKLVTIYPFVGGTAQKHSINLIDPEAFQMTWFGSGIHSETGWRGNGVNSYGYTGVNESGLFNNQSFGVYNRILSFTEHRRDMGTINNNLCLYWNSNSFYGHNQGTIFDVKEQSKQGLFVVNLGSVKANDGNPLPISVGGVKGDLDFVIGGRNNGNSISHISDKEYCYSFIGEGLTEFEMTAHYNAIQKLQTDLKRESNGRI